MAVLTRWLLASFLATFVSALQVTPNSPCAEFCLDSEDLDRSDPESSSTQAQQITCDDSDYQSGAKGRKFQQCLTCLQESPFETASESDQLWFLCKWILLPCLCLTGKLTEIFRQPQIHAWPLYFRFPQLDRHRFRALPHFVCLRTLGRCLDR